MATAKDLCAESRSNSSHPNEKGMTILLADFNDSMSSPPTASGTYTVYPGLVPPSAKAAFVEVEVLDAMCQHVMAQQALGASGTVTLTSVGGFPGTGNRFSGNFDLVLDSGDHVTGSFDPGKCPALDRSFPLSFFTFCK